jgi:hypothetical protein
MTAVETGIPSLKLKKVVVPSLKSKSLLLVFRFRVQQRFFSRFNPEKLIVSSGMTAGSGAKYFDLED